MPFSTWIWAFFYDSSVTYSCYSKGRQGSKKPLLNAYAHKTFILFFYRCRAIPYNGSFGRYFHKFNSDSCVTYYASSVYYVMVFTF